MDLLPSYCCRGAGECFPGFLEDADDDGYRIWLVLL